MTTPDEPLRHASRAEGLARATDETSGHMIDGDTPPAEGSGVGPTNPDMDVEKTGERSWPKIVVGLLIALVVLFLVLFVLGRIASIG